MYVRLKYVLTATAPLTSRFRHLFMHAASNHTPSNFHIYISVIGHALSLKCINQILRPTSFAYRKTNANSPPTFLPRSKYVPHTIPRSASNRARRAYFMSLCEDGHPRDAAKSFSENLSDALVSCFCSSQPLCEMRWQLSMLHSVVRPPLLQFSICHQCPRHSE